MNLKRVYIGLIILILTINLGCVEQINLLTESFEDTLVIEAAITDELKVQQIKLSRTFPLEGGLVFEDNADVRIIDNNNNIYVFDNIGGGIYNSTIEFQVQSGVSYKLLVTTSDGKEYNSNEETLPENIGISDVYAELVRLANNIGVQVLVDSEDSTGETKYFRYEYEETYQRIAKRFYPFDIVISDVSGSGEDIQYSIREERRPENERVCYSSRNSNEIIVTSTDGLAEQKVSQFPVRFIRSNNFIIRDRYSILVKQYVQSADANNYYRLLKEITSDESLFIDKQPGFIQGNVFSSTNADERVIGFFDISSVSSKRIFFTYSDFDIREQPEYPFFCEDEDTLSYNRLEDRPRLHNLIVNRGYKSLGGTDSNDPLEYRITRPQCGDCSSYASNVRPDFWED